MTKDDEREENIEQGLKELPSFKGAISAVDQIGTIWKDIGTSFGIYYKTLIDGGIPVETAKEMITELHGLFWSTQFVPDVHIHTDDIL